MTCWPGVRLLERAAPVHWARTAVDKTADHAELDVGLEERRADLGQGLIEVGVG